jgi:heme/copper-type cytochrome/quinol oxidase subunit 2
MKNAPEGPSWLLLWWGWGFEPAIWSLWGLVRPSSSLANTCVSYFFRATLVNEIDYHLQSSSASDLPHPSFSKDHHMRKTLLLIVMPACLAAPLAQAADSEVNLTLKNHLFTPAEIKVPANQRIKLSVHNQDSTPEEFESHALNREKLIPAGAKAVIYIGPLKPGRYDFFGEFNPSTAKGLVVAE